jgi:hypothetical protein
MELEGCTEANGIVVRVLSWALPLELKFQKLLRNPEAMSKIMAMASGSFEISTPLTPTGGGVVRATPTPPTQPAKPTQSTNFSDPLKALEILKTLD